MNFNIKKIITATCLAAFVATSFLPGISEAANGRMSLAQAQQEVKRPLHQKYPHYKLKQSHKVSPGHRNKFSHHGVNKHRPAMHTRGPVSQTWGPVRHAPRHTMKSHGPVFKNKKHGLKAHSPIHRQSHAHNRHPGIRR